MDGRMNGGSATMQGDDDTKQGKGGRDKTAQRASEREETKAKRASKKTAHEQSQRSSDEEKKPRSPPLPSAYSHSGAMPEVLIVRCHGIRRGRVKGSSSSYHSRRRRNRSHGRRLCFLSLPLLLYDLLDSGQLVNERNLCVLLPPFERPLPHEHARLIKHKCKS